MSKKIIKKNLGFTLIELLVVISIIGLLSSVVMASLNSARAKARDANRMAGIKQLQLALEMYYNDNGTYPDAVPAATGYGKEINSGQATWDTTSNLRTTLVGGGYLPALPTDPLNTGGATWNGGFTFTYSTYTVAGSPTLGSDYDLTVHLENPNIIACPTTSHSINTDPSDSWCNYSSNLLSDH
ncbi:hypothetical protein A2442_03465 [Candidatus Campbellbacteria bacterium RIFOXYC2_FULL_35_25]|uniref:Type II secretion system protein GspG C-terminal domain-containing protein n=1 Tax=Candidatus Campbellbacteria bacterium RIFOXYC2_FULL_35_25 TaxID=1797582 RepID=A0A1F5EHR6_9BACT|nr:MAG: hypothetical protein A2442_03465 [Candidatus Campbellbacteria bacterium RIFOXYC2_FULL_35_25]